MKWLKEFWVKLWAEAAVQRPATASQMSAGNLTPRAQRVLLLARKEAERLHLPFIGTEHVLLGLSLLGAGVATNVLNKIGLELEVIQAEVEKLAGGQPAETSGERAHYAPLIKEMLSFASQEAKELNHTYIGTEHLLLALLRQTDGGAAEIFKNRNVNTEEVRKEIIKELSPVYIPHVPGKRCGVLAIRIESCGEPSRLPVASPPIDRSQAALRYLLRGARWEDGGVSECAVQGAQVVVGAIRLSDVGFCGVGATGWADGLRGEVEHRAVLSAWREAGGGRAGIS